MKTFHRLSLALLAPLGFAACSPAPPGAAPDAGPVTQAPPDAGLDGDGVTDSGRKDASTTDATVADANPAPDAATGDATTHDASGDTPQPDSGTTADASNDAQASDGSANVDAGNDATPADGSSQGDAAPDGGGTSLDAGRDATLSDASTPPDAASDSGPGLDSSAPDGWVGPWCASPCLPGQKICNSVCVAITDPDFGCTDVGCSSCAIAPNSASMACAGGACTLGQCAPGFDDCDKSAANGCEANLTSPATCGKCSACDAGQVCNAESCASSCTFPQTTCDGGACHDLSSDPMSCGTCGNVCPLPAGAGAIATCTNGGCGVSCPNDAGCPAPCCYVSSVPGCVACPLPCGVGFDTCGGSCVATDSDQANCGGCGITCDAGAGCLRGECVASGSVQWLVHSANSMAQDTKNIYFTDTATNSVYQVDKSTATVTLLAANQATPYRVAVDDAYVYWTSNLGGAVLRTPIGADAGAFQVLYSATSPTGLAVDDTTVYWSATTAIYGASKAGGGTVRSYALPEFYRGPQTTAPETLTQDTQKLYGAAQVYNGVSFPSSEGFSVNKADAAVEVIASLAENVGAVCAVAPSASAVYALECEDLPPSVTLNWTPFEGSRSTTTASTQNFYGAMAIDGCNVYIDNYGTTIYRVVPNGTLPYPVVTLATTAQQLLVDDTYLYWIDGAGFIGRVSK